MPWLAIMLPSLSFLQFYSTYSGFLITFFTPTQQVVVFQLKECKAVDKNQKRKEKKLQKISICLPGISQSLPMFICPGLWCNRCVSVGECHWELCTVCAFRLTAKIHSPYAPHPAFTTLLHRKAFTLSASPEDKKVAECDFVCCDMEPTQSNRRL